MTTVVEMGSGQRFAYFTRCYSILTRYEKVVMRRVTEASSQGKIAKANTLLRGLIESMRNGIGL